MNLWALARRPTRIGWWVLCAYLGISVLQIGLSFLCLGSVSGGAATALDYVLHDPAKTWTHLVLLPAGALLATEFMRKNAGRRAPRDLRVALAAACVGALGSLVDTAGAVSDRNRILYAPDMSHAADVVRLDRHLRDDQAPPDVLSVAVDQGAQRNEQAVTVYRGLYQGTWRLDEIRKDGLSLSSLPEPANQLGLRWFGVVSPAGFTSGLMSALASASVSFILALMLFNWIKRPALRPAIRALAGSLGVGLAPWFLYLPYSQWWVAYETHPEYPQIWFATVAIGLCAVAAWPLLDSLYTQRRGRIEASGLLGAIVYGVAAHLLTKHASAAGAQALLLGAFERVTRPSSVAPFLAAGGVALVALLLMNRVYTLPEERWTWKRKSRRATS